MCSKYTAPNWSQLVFTHKLCRTFFVTSQVFHIFVVIWKIQNRLKMTWFNKCCHCIPLQFGGVILGFISLLVSSLLTFIYLYSTAVILESRRSTPTQNQLNSTALENPSSSENTSQWIEIFCNLAFNICWIITAVFLILGSIKVKQNVNHKWVGLK